MSSPSGYSIEIYTDGGCSPNPGAGGWAALLSCGSHEKLISGSYAHTTNNRMELMAVIEGLKSLKKTGLRVDVYSDSKYVCQAFCLGWIGKWQVSGWVTAGKKPVKNQDLWQVLSALVDQHSVQFHHVPAHSGIEKNEFVDQAAGEARRQKDNFRHDEVFECERKSEKK